ncbi:MAG: c-type cytochrome [Halieaceae bacterium]|nr:c-type cytochrome [Halieaceae bacterium]
MSRLILVAAMMLMVLPAHAQRDKLTPQQAEQAAANYQQYCALCHGENREGHANDHAPSLRSKSLMASSFPWAFMYATGYGRPGTPMGPYYEEVGGPLDRKQLWQLGLWLRQQVEVEPVKLPLDAVAGDVELGAKVYADNCAECHGAKGEGVTGTALGNQAMLAFTIDEFLKYAIVNGRDGTDMRAFAGELSEAEINGVTAFLRSRASGWSVERPVYKKPPDPDEYILNPDGDAPDFELKDDMYVMSADLDKALREGRRMVLLDTRNLALWQMANIDGSVPLPYYYPDRNTDQLVADLPDDGTMIVTYCECPRAAAESVNRKLAERGFKNLAVLWEGIQGWISLGYPVVMGETETVEVVPLHEPQPET